MFYTSYKRSKVNDGSIIYSSASDKLKEKLGVIQNVALRIMLGARNAARLLSLQAESELPPLSLRRGFLTVRENVKIKN